MGHETRCEQQSAVAGIFIRERGGKANICPPSYQTPSAGGVFTFSNVTRRFRWLRRLRQETASSPSRSNRWSQNQSGVKIRKDKHMMTKDPVCGKQVDENKAPATTSYQGQKYSFCGQDCKNKFDQQPQKLHSKRSEQAAGARPPLVSSERLPNAIMASGAARFSKCHISRSRTTV